MLRKQIVPDRVLLNRVSQRLARAGLGAGCAVRVSVKNGQVTLSGTLQRDLQRRPAVRAATGIDGVRQVVDQMKVDVKKARMEPKKVNVEAKNLDTQPENLDKEAEEQTDENKSS